MTTQSTQSTHCILCISQISVSALSAFRQGSDFVHTLLQLATMAAFSFSEEKTSRSVREVTLERRASCRPSCGEMSRSHAQEELRQRPRRCKGIGSSVERLSEVAVITEETVQPHVTLNAAASFLQELRPERPTFGLQSCVSSSLLPDKLGKTRLLSKKKYL